MRTPISITDVSSYPGEKHIWFMQDYNYQWLPKENYDHILLANI